MVTRINQGRSEIILSERLRGIDWSAIRCLDPLVLLQGDLYPDPPQRTDAAAVQASNEYLTRLWNEFWELLSSPNPTATAWLFTGPAYATAAGRVWHIISERWGSLAQCLFRNLAARQKDPPNLADWERLGRIQELLPTAPRLAVLYTEAWKEANGPWAASIKILAENDALNTAFPCTLIENPASHQEEAQNVEILANQQVYQGQRLADPRRERQIFDAQTILTGQWVFAQIARVLEASNDARDALWTELGLSDAQRIAAGEILGEMIRYLDGRKASQCKECFGVGHYESISGRRKEWQELKDKVKGQGSPAKYLNKRHYNAGVASKSLRGFIFQVYGPYQHRHPCGYFNVAMAEQTGGANPIAKSFKNDLKRYLDREVLFEYKRDDAPA